MSNVVNFTPRDTTATGPASVAHNGESAPIGRMVYTVKEVAHMLSLNLGGTYALIRSGDIPAIKLGGRWAIPRRRFHEWLESCRVDPQTDPHPSPADVETARAEVAAAIQTRAHRHGTGR
ncbi:helix-turn-helix domain-containing protein [Micromonospora sp. WMMD730]|uniref:helix-turn-helix domain-containing protein n=1 Tax=Micromonospora sp. WMMD730 TaxID=3404128 RepID=UPI003B92872B